MEKLIELLNEYEENRIEKINSEGKLMFKLSFRPYTEESLKNKAYRSCWLEICSKYYGFIKWLVENDKIDTTEIDKKIRIYDYVEEYEEYEYVFPDIYESLLMLLSIQDNPINFLLSVIK